MYFKVFAGLGEELKRVEWIDVHNLTDELYTTL